MIDRRELQRNVLRGVALLDEKDPAWWNGGKKSKHVLDGMVGHIDLGTLDLSHPSACVLGQRHEDGYSSGVAALGLYSADEQLRYGFDHFWRCRKDKGADMPACRSFLTELWASVIQSRRYPKRKIAKDPFCVEANKTWVRA